MKSFLFYHATSQASVVIITIALMLFVGYLMTRITRKFKLPNVTGYILAGILMGPYCLDMVPMKVIDGMDFLSDIALAFIAFSTGEFFRFSVLKKNGWKVIVITVMEAVLASVCVFAVVYGVLHLNLAFSIVLAALASATAPASTIMTIRQTGAKGDFVDTLLQVVALDDVVGLVEYSAAISIALAAFSGTGGFQVGNILKPILINGAVLVLGGIFGWLLKCMMPKRKYKDNRLIISVAALFAFCGICSLADVSPLLGCMSMGTIYINLSDDDKLFKQLNYFSPPILLLFFVRSGLSFRLDALLNPSAGEDGASLLVIGVAYFLTRIIGKYAGAYLGCLAVHKKKQVRNYLGLALVPQAGVAIGLAALGARTLGGQMGIDLQTVILASSVLYELTGPACAKLSLYLSGSYGDIELPKEAKEKDPVTRLEMLIERIHEIQQEIPETEENISPEEQAFLEAANEQYEAVGALRNHLRARRTY